MASYEKYKENFNNLAAQLRAASASLGDSNVKTSIVDLCIAIETEIKSDIATSLEFFEKYKDISQIERATFLGMARDTMHLAIFKIMLCSDPEAVESFANGSIKNLIFATDLMICERDGKSKWSLYDDVH